MCLTVTKLFFFGTSLVYAYASRRFHIKPWVYYMTHEEPGPNYMIIRFGKSVNQVSQLLRAAAVFSGSSWIFSECPGRQVPSYKQAEHCWGPGLTSPEPCSPVFGPDTHELEQTCRSCLRKSPVWESFGALTFKLGMMTETWMTLTVGQPPALVTWLTMIIWIQRWDHPTRLLLLEMLLCLQLLIKDRLGRDVAWLVPSMADWTRGGHRTKEAKPKLVKDTSIAWPPTDELSPAGPLFELRG